MTIKISQLKARLAKDSLGKSILLLVGGTAGGQIIPILMLPLTSRLYTPENFGAFGIVIAIVGILGVFATMRYETAIPLPDSEEEASRVVALALRINVIITLLLLCTSWLPMAWFAKAINHPEIAELWWVIPTGVFLVGLYQTINFWAVRRKMFKPVAQSKLLLGVSLAGFQIALGLGGFSDVGLFIAYLLSQVLGIAVLFKPMLQDFYGFNLQDELNLAKRYKRFPLLSTIPALINSVVLQVPVLLVSQLYGIGVAGYFSFANRLVGAPASIIAQSTTSVFFAEAADKKRKGSTLMPAFWGIIKRQLYMVAPALLVAPFIPVIVPLIFGSQWGEAGLYAAILLIGFAASMIASPVGATLDVLELQHLHWYRELLRLAILLSLVGPVWYFDLSPVWCMVSISAAMVLSSCLYAFISWLAIRQHHKKVFLSNAQH